MIVRWKWHDVGWWISSLVSAGVDTEDDTGRTARCQHCRHSAVSPVLTRHWHQLCRCRYGVLSVLHIGLTLMGFIGIRHRVHTHLADSLLQQIYAHLRNNKQTQCDRDSSQGALLASTSKAQGSCNLDQAWIPACCGAAHNLRLMVQLKPLPLSHTFLQACSVQQLDHAQHTSALGC